MYLLKYHNYLKIMQKVMLTALKQMYQMQIRKMSCPKICSKFVKHIHFICNIKNLKVLLKKYALHGECRNAKRFSYIICSHRELIKACMQVYPKCTVFINFVINALYLEIIYNRYTEKYFKDRVVGYKQYFNLLVKIFLG